MSENADREEVMNEIWGDSEIVPAEAAANEQEAAEDKQEVTEPDPWESVPSVLRDEFESLRTKVSAYEALEYRLKQAENRLGSVQNDLHSAKEAAKTVASAPSAKQIELAYADDTKWESLKEDFPEWSEATDNRINNKLLSQREALFAELSGMIPDISLIKDEEENKRLDLEERIKLEVLGSIVEMTHPDWQETCAKPEFKQWMEKNNKQDTWNPRIWCATLDEYAEYTAGKKSPSEVAAERQQRLSAAESPRGRAVTIPKSESEMTPEEMRASVAREVFI